jgi:hypothetical protein
LPQIINFIRPMKGLEMSQKVAVSKINIKIGKKEIPLTLEQAKELQELLNETFGNKNEVVYVPGSPVYIPHPRPYRYPKTYWSVTTDNIDSTAVFNSGGVYLRDANVEFAEPVIELKYCLNDAS